VDELGAADPLREGVRRIVAAIVALTVLAPAAQVDAHHSKLDTSRKKYRAVLPDAYYDTLAMCESRGNWQRKNALYTGGLGIYKGTAYRWSGKRNLHRLTPNEQVEIADRIAFLGWDNPKKKTNSFKYPVGPYGWGCVKIRTTLQRYICASKHPKVQRWKRGC
jgi:hypothetical protein